MPQLQQPKSKKPPKRQASVPRPQWRDFGRYAKALSALAAFGFALGAAPGGGASKSAPLTLPLNSSLYVVLDGRIDSRGSKPGSSVAAHLKSAIVLGGHVIAPAGAPVTVRINSVQPAQIGNVDGFVDIYVEPLRLADGALLPLLTPTSRIDPRMTSGQRSTRNITDTVGDILIPYHYVYHILRKGMDVDLRPGTIIRVRTAAVVSLKGGAVSISAPPPLIANFATPAPGFSPTPFATPLEMQYPAPSPRTTPPAPMPSPTVSPA